VTAENIFALAETVIAGRRLEQAEATALAQSPEEVLWVLVAAADLLRRHFRGPAVSFCAIINARSGNCDQDCAFCAQSGRYRTDAPTYPLVEPSVVGEAANRAGEAGAGRFSLVTSGRALSRRDLEKALAGVQAIAAAGLKPCASLGLLNAEDLTALKDAGLLRYHHNLEAAAGFYPRICTTRSYDDNRRVLREARDVGLEVCAGCLFGLGETWEQRVELLLALEALDVDAVPINFLIPIPGTPLADRPRLAPREALRILALARFCLPTREIRLCGGRDNLGPLAGMLFFAGASGLMIGDLLTTKGPQMESDRRLVSALGLRLRED